MSSLFSSLTSSTFEKLLDKATSQVNLDPDWETILQICDSIRQRDITAKNAVIAIKKKIHDNNPRVAYFALVVLEACVKNCGSPIHDEIASKSFLDDIRTHVKIAPENVKDKILELVQSWSKAFANSSSYTSFQDTYNIMKMEGYNFPPVKEADIMFTSEKAPEWIDGEECHMCHVNFGLIQRKHHCRKCGQVFCGQCSSKTSTIPQYGIEREVRVCDHCYNQLKSKNADHVDATSAVPQSSDQLPAEYLNSALYKESLTPAQPRNDSDLRLQEEDDLQLALAMSLNELDNKSHLQTSSSTTPSSQSITIPKSSLDTNVDKAVSSASAPTVTEPEELDPELARYLDRSYWESRKEENETKTTESKSKSVTSAKSTSTVNSVSVKNIIEENHVAVIQETKVQSINPDPEADEDIVFLQTFTSSLLLFKERMEKASAEGRSIVIDASIQSLFQSLTAMHPQLLKISDETDLWKAEYESIMLKLKKVEDARTHLSERRTQYQESLKEQERRQMEFRRIQMEEKLALRRRQKEQYLRYQREMETERQRAEEQQRLQQLQFSQQMHNQYMNRFQPSFNQNPVTNGNIANQAYNSSGNFVPPPQIQQQPVSNQPVAQALEANQQYNNVEASYNQNRQPSQTFNAPDAAMNQNLGMPNSVSIHQPSSQLLIDSSQSFGYSDPNFNQNHQQISFNSTDNAPNQPSTTSGGSVSPQQPTQSLQQQYNVPSAQNFSPGSLYQNQSPSNYQSGPVGSPSQVGSQAQLNYVSSNPNQAQQFSSNQPQPQNPQQQFPQSSTMQVSSPQNYGNILPQNMEQSNLPLGYAHQSPQGMQFAQPQQNMPQTSEMQPLIVFD